MPTEEGIADAIEMLRAAGCAMTRGQTVSGVGVAWLVSMPELSDRQLLAACLAHLRGQGCQWWPKPGQLLAHLGATSADDPAGEDWGRLRRLRGLHGGQMPESPDAPRPFELAADRPEAQARWCGLDDCGGWRAFLTAPDPLTFEVGYLRALQSAERQLADPRCRWSEAVCAEVSGWVKRADSQEAYTACHALAGACGASMSPRDPRQPKGYRMHQDPQRERAMWAGCMAAGGWREIWPDGAAIPNDLRPSDAANRKQFIAAHRAVMGRSRRALESSKVAALVDLAVDDMMLTSDMSNVVSLEARRRLGVDPE